MLAWPSSSATQPAGEGAEEFAVLADAPDLAADGADLGARTLELEHQRLHRVEVGDEAVAAALLVVVQPFRNTRLERTSSTSMPRFERRRCFGTRR